MAPNIGQPKSVTSTSAIASFFYKKIIFITGATGFVGKCLIEKLFRSCPGMNNSFFNLL
jgi:FlaA1/EpsC-like NDP-sugar epimerase